MNTTYSTHSWLGAFAARLLQLQPEMNAVMAVQYAVRHIHHAADLDPLTAAEIFVQATPTVASAARPGSTRQVRAGGVRESHAARYREMFGFAPQAVPTAAAEAQHAGE